MANLQVKDIDDRLYEALRSSAKSENRSISQEVVTILEKYLADPQGFKNSPVQDFLSLSGSWMDSRTAEETVLDIKSGRKNSKRFRSDNVLFD